MPHRLWGAQPEPLQDPAGFAVLHRQVRELVIVSKCWSGVVLLRSSGRSPVFCYFVLLCGTSWRLFSRGVVFILFCSGVPNKIVFFEEVGGSPQGVALKAVSMANV